MGSNTYGYAFDPILLRRGYGGHVGNRQSADSLVANVASSNAYVVGELNTYATISNSVDSVLSVVDPSYDLDESMTQNGDWHHTYNGENRLVVSSNAATGAKVVNAYDYIGRRVVKSVYDDLSGGVYGSTISTSYVWDEYNPAGGTGYSIIRQYEFEGELPRYGLPPTIDEQKSFVWGLDLSGSLQGAGGVGGALSMVRNTGTSDPSGDGPSANEYLYCFDANGNVANLIDSSDGAVSATYEYSPFGETVVAEGDLADVNPIRFSTKHADVGDPGPDGVGKETGLVSYEYRYYDPVLGRWPSRDPIGEIGGVNLYGFVGNSPIFRTDLDGRQFQYADQRPAAWLPHDWGGLGPQSTASRIHSRSLR